MFQLRIKTSYAKQLNKMLKIYMTDVCCTTVFEVSGMKPVNKKSWSKENKELVKTVWALQRMAPDCIK